MLGLDTVHTTLCSRGEIQEEEEEEKGDGGGKKSEAGDSDPADSVSPPTPAEGKIDGEHQPPPPPADEDGSEGEGGGSAESAAPEAAPELLRFKIEMDLGLDTRCEAATYGCERRGGGGESDKWCLATSTGVS